MTINCKRLIRYVPNSIQTCLIE